jgi:hypothetical protein
LERARAGKDAGISIVTQEIMMKHLSMLMLSLGAALGISAQAADQVPSREQTGTTQQTQTQTQESERIYGYELMTPQERVEYHNRMRAAKTEQERETLRLEHHQQMQARAKAQGKILPDVPPADRGPGMGPGGGMGPGYMGPGYRR